jgi:hypothetical protein
MSFEKIMSQLERHFKVLVDVLASSRVAVRRSCCGSFNSLTLAGMIPNVGVDGSESWGGKIELILAVAVVRNRPVQSKTVANRSEALASLSD